MENLQENSLNNFVICSEKQIDKITFPANKLAINFKGDTSHFIQRNVAIQMLILEIYKNYL